MDQAAFDEYKAKFMAAMDNDLNTSMAVTVLYDVLKAKTNDKTKLALLDSFDTVLGLKLLEKAAALRARAGRAPSCWRVRRHQRGRRGQRRGGGADPRPRRCQEGQEFCRGRPHPR